MLTLAEIASELSLATGRDIAYVRVPHEAFVASVAESGAPKEVVWMLDYLFSTVLDGRNAYLTDGVQRALGRPPRDFAEYAREIAASGVWEAVEAASQEAAVLWQHYLSRWTGLKTLRTAAATAAAFAFTPGLLQGPVDVA